jgi:hypothetical protein
MEQKYIIFCSCGFRRVSDGSAEATSDLKEVVLCAKCGGSKNFKCPQCGFIAKAQRWVVPPDPTAHRFVKN